MIDLDHVTMVAGNPKSNTAGNNGLCLVSSLEGAQERCRFSKLFLYLCC